MAEPHPETGLEFWAIQAAPIAGEVVGHGRIVKLLYEADASGKPKETRIELELEHLLTEGSETNMSIIEPGERFQDIVYDRDISKTFIVHLQPSREGTGFITYWDGFGVREATAGDFRSFKLRWHEWRQRNPAGGKAAQRVKMLEWGLRCAAVPITRWDGVLAIRDAVHPGEEYRDHTQAMAVVTPERWKLIRATWLRVRDETPRDYRIGTVMMEALAWMTPDPLFHHEVRHWSAKLRLDAGNWTRHFDGFWREFEGRRAAGRGQR